MPPWTRCAVLDPSPAPYARMSSSSGWLEDVAVGALAGGVNTPTSVFLKVVVALLLIPESALLAVAVRKGFAVGHCIAIIALTLVLLGLLVW